MRENDMAGFLSEADRAANSGDATLCIRRRQGDKARRRRGGPPPPADYRRSEEHTSELQSLMRISYAVFCLKKKTNIKTKHQQTDDTIRICNILKHMIITTTQ